MVDYVETSDTPISRHDFVTGGGGGISLDTSADGGMTPASAFVQADSSKTASGSAAAQIAEATAAITFRPLVTDLVVQTVNEIPSPVLPGCCIKWRNGISGLYDVTAGAAVLAFEGLITPAEYIVSLNLEHLYTIYASAPNAAGESPEFGARLNIFPAPESESTLTFFVLGLGALLIARSPTFRPSGPISDT